MAPKQLQRPPMTPEQQKANNERDRRRRASMTPEERKAEAERARRRRSEMTMQQRGAEAERSKRRRLAITQQRVDRNEAVMRLQSTFLGRNTNNRPTTHDVGKKDLRCVNCNAIHFKSEKTTRGKFSGCCGSGSVQLQDLPEFPAVLTSWLTEPTADGKHFRENIRRYNSAFAFASFGYQPVKFNSGLQNFVIHGQVYHKTSQSINANEKPSYAQLYILDPDYAKQQRMENDHNKECREEFFIKIDEIICQINPFAGAYKMMRDCLVENAGQQKSIEMWITKDRQHDPRRYNLPVANEVAAVFVSEDGEPPFNRDISVHPVGNQPLQWISIISPNCDPMTYPLLFPHGDPGWQPGIPKSGKSPTAEEEDDEETSTRNVSMLQFYSFRLQERLIFNPLLHSGKLTQQYVVDAFLKVEGQRLQWNRQNQKKLRVDLYIGLMDYVHTQAEQQHLKAGRMVILPSSFTGGKRAMQQNYQDAMVLVAKFGKPDLFITFTCNPKWKEITEELKYGETTIDRPDLIATVFKLKLKDFMNDMTDKCVLGRVKAFISVIEFQKRGLPHCHMLFILNDEDKLKEIEDIDSVVCAEIPDPIEDPQLFEIVKTCMLHGPCGELNQNASCMGEEKGCRRCMKDFPKAFRETTNANVNGYPLYRRPENGRKVNVRGTVLDNRWVVPYNPYLSRKYNAHINVEVCSSVQSVKYIFKYVYKGHDAAIVKVAENGESGVYNWDEVQTFLDTRYISSPEAMWRLRKYDMCSRSHAIERLPVHLPFQQVVVFEEGQEEQQLRQAEKKGTKLTKWFELNESSESSRRLLYTEIPYHYVWTKNFWKVRERGAEKILPRMYSVSPKDMERFSLRLLLLHVRGARSYDDIKTVNGVVYETFHEAAKALNLLEDDREWHNTMDEAVIFRMPSELRQLFATILIHAIPTNAKELYQKFKANMMEDYLLTHSEYMAEQMALKNIEEYLSQFGKHCSDFGMPTPVDAYENEDGMDWSREKEEATQLVTMMNAEQRTAFGIIMDAVEGKRGGKCYFLSGAGGCGKTFVYKALTAAILSDGGLVKSVAPTGLAATLLKGGKTVHSGFGIPIHLNEHTISRFKQGSAEWKDLIRTKLIIWDEISMSHAHLLNAVDRSLRDLLNCNKPFGGIPIVVGGDFRQQAPVVLHGTRVQVVEACAKSSAIWKCFEELKLVRNMRVRGDEKEFAEWLLSVGEGKNGDTETNFVKIPSELLSDDLINSVFGPDIRAMTPNELATRAILCPKNEDTLKVNQQILALLEGVPKVYYSIDSVEDSHDEEERTQYPMEFLNSLTPMGLPPHILNLKKGCCVTLLRNLNTRKGLCNGTRLIVESLGTNLVECSIFTGERRGERVFIPRIPLDADNSDVPFKLRRKQFPLRLAYSMTITKSQGQTFDRIGLFLPEPVFTHGQLYTAFSRVRSKDGLFVKIKDSSRQGAIYENDESKYTINCVYREILK